MINCLFNFFLSFYQVDGQQYTGQGRSKKIARIQAAAAALRSFIQFKDGAVLSPIKPVHNLDFTSDEHLDNGIESTKIDKLVELMKNKLVQKSDNISSKYFFKFILSQIFKFYHSFIPLIFP